jgi:hypothetical protein
MPNAFSAPRNVGDLLAASDHRLAMTQERSDARAVVSRPKFVSPALWAIESGSDILCARLRTKCTRSCEQI